MLLGWGVHVVHAVAARRGCGWCPLFAQFNIQAIIFWKYPRSSSAGACVVRLARSSFLHFLSPAQIVYDNPEKFNLDRPISDADVRALVDGAVGFLCQEGSPQLDTVRMQVR